MRLRQAIPRIKKKLRMRRITLVSSLFQIIMKKILHIMDGVLLIMLMETSTKEICRIINFMGKESLHLPMECTMMEIGSKDLNMDKDFLKNQEFSNIMVAGKMVI